MIELIKVSATKFIKENYKFLSDTYVESGQLGEKLNINTAVYKTLEDGGYLLSLKIMDGANLVGYTTVTAMPGMHNVDKLIGLVDILYIKPEYRSLRLFNTVLKTLENTLKNYGIQILQIASPAKRDISKLLERSKYNLLEKLYFKSLEN